MTAKTEESLASSTLLPSSLSSSFLSPVSLAGRRHSIYGTEDRVVLDIGSSFLKCGFSSESRPRHIFPVSLEFKRHDFLDASCNEGCHLNAQVSATLYNLKNSTDLNQTKSALEYYLRDVYYKFLLTDPKQRRVIISEPPLLPLAVKQLMAKVLFEHFQVPAITFVPLHQVALLTCARTTGIVVDCGHAETCILPIFDARPLYSFVTSTSMGGQALSERLLTLLLSYARLKDSENVLTAEMISAATVEDIKTRLLFISPFKPMRMLQPPSSLSAQEMAKRASVRVEEKAEDDDDDDEEEEEQQQENDYFLTRYRDSSAATDVNYRFVRADTNEWTTMIIPGWVRERAGELFFDDNDLDRPSVIHSLLNMLLKMQPDLRGRLAEAGILLIGGCSMIPNFQPRFHQDLIKALDEPRYAKIKGIAGKLRFLEEGEKGKIFPGNSRGWVGASLLGALKIQVLGEIVKENWNGQVPDWSQYSSLSPSNAAPDSPASGPVLFSSSVAMSAAAAIEINDEDNNY